MPSLTRAEAAALGRRADQPVKAPGELLCVFVGGALVNGKNQSRGWQMKAWGRYKREWKERVAQALLEIGWRRVLHGPPTPLLPRTTLVVQGGGFVNSFVIDARLPKRVTFEAHTRNAMDSDGLQLAIVPIRDALVECGVVSGDAERDGHLWEYAQKIDRAHRGVTIRVSLRPPREGRGA
jgi:hypothetical protein